MGSLFFYLQNDDNFHDLGDEFGGVLFAASFVGQNLFTQNHQGGVVCGISFDGGVAPFFVVQQKVGAASARTPLSLKEPPLKPWSQPPGLPRVLWATTGVFKT